MRETLRHVTGVSWPRSGHHLLVRILKEYFEHKDNFKYCDFYSYSGCCKRVPCVASNDISLTKNHDFLQRVPILEGHLYLIQYRRFQNALVSNYELHCVNTKEDSRELFQQFALNEARKYTSFMERWSAAPPPGSEFLRVSYEKLTSTPVDAVARVIEFLCPFKKAARSRIEPIVTRISRQTVEVGAGSLESAFGVAEYRDVKQFRYYSPNFFAEVERQTAPAYLLMSKQPTLTSTPFRRRFHNLWQVRRDGEKLYIDVSGQMALLGTAPTGIPRVQAFVARCAAQDRDPRVQCVIFDERKKAFRQITTSEANQLINDHNITTAGHKALKVVLREAVEKIRGNPSLGKEFDRNFGAQVANPIYRPYIYAIAKNGIRAYRIGRKLLGRLGSKGKTSFNFVDVREGTVLFSHRLFSGRMFGSFIEASTRGAIIFYDDLPLVQHKLMADADNAVRIRNHLDLLFASGIEALCISEHSRHVLNNYLEAKKEHAVRLHTFPIPSTLFFKAHRVGRAKRFAPEEPFVLYCSTVEVRKNHLMLAEIWHRSVMRGNPLPPIICVGKLGWGVDALTKFLAERPQLRSHFRLIGAVDDLELADLYRTASFAVFPSFFEGWGLGASESLDFGLPVIVSTTPALQEAVRGLMPSIDPTDLGAWESEIWRLVNNREALEKLRATIARNYEPVSEQASWGTIKNALIDPFT